MLGGVIRPSIVGRSFYDSDDSETEYTITRVVGDNVSTSGGKYNFWKMKYVTEKLAVSSIKKKKEEAREARDKRQEQRASALSWPTPSTLLRSNQVHPNKRRNDE